MRIVKKSVLLYAITICTLNMYGQYDTLLNYAEVNTLLDIARENKDQKSLANLYKILGDYEGNNFGDFGKSLEYYGISRQYFQLLNDDVPLKNLDLMIGKRYTQIGLYQDAINTFKSILASNNNSKYKREEGYAHYYLSQTYRKIIEPELARYHLDKATSLVQSIDDQQFKTELLFEKIYNNLQDNDLDSALIMSYEAVQLSKKWNDSEMLSKSLYFIGKINKDKGDIQKAEKYLLNSIAFLPIMPYNEHRRDVYKEISDIYIQNEDFRNAFEYLQKYSLLNDSILNKNRMESMANLALKYGIKDKLSSIEGLKIDKAFAEEKNKAQRRALYILGIGLALLLIIIYYIVKFYDHRIKTSKIINIQKEEINTQRIRELEDKIKISSMRSVIDGQEIERERIAKDLHDSLGGLLSTIKLQFDQVNAKNNDIQQSKEFANAQKLLDHAVEEVRNISRNLQPSALQNFGLIAAIKDLIYKFEGESYPEIDLQYYNVPQHIDKMKALHIYRLIQELLNNSIKHAHASEIFLQINSEEKDLIITFEDDGKGFDPENPSHKGMGLENLKSRTNYLQGSLIIDSKPGKGMSAIIKINLDTDVSQPA